MQPLFKALIHPYSMIFVKALLNHPCSILVVTLCSGFQAASTCCLSSKRLMDSCHVQGSFVQASSKTHTPVQGSFVQGTCKTNPCSRPYPCSGTLAESLKIRDLADCLSSECIILRSNPSAFLAQPLLGAPRRSTCQSLREYR